MGSFKNPSGGQILIYRLPPLPPTSPTIDASISRCLASAFNNVSRISLAYAAIVKMLLGKY